MGLISKRYAKALYAHAAQTGEEESCYRQMQLLAHNLHAVPHLRETLGSPVVAHAEKMQLLDQAAGTHPGQSGHDFMQLVLANRREKSLLEIALSFLTLYRRRKNISVVHLASAVEIPPGIQSRIHDRVEQRTHGKVEFSTRIDPSLEGGFIFQLDDLRLDASLANQLQRVRRQFSQQNKTIEN
jgi:F-type H+-transporting ATPase subunit delta